MDFRITALVVLWATLCMMEGVLSNPQRTLNSVQAPGKLTTTSKGADDPKQAKIMKQINKVNEDGSYTFGYEADDGSFRVETRSKDGVVKGKYGYVDANGELKTMEYTAGEKTAGDDQDQDEEAEREEESPRPKPTRGSFQSQSQSSTPAGTQILQRRPVTQVRYLTRQTKSAPSVALPPKDQTFAAQTNREEKADEESGESEGEKDSSSGPENQAEEGDDAGPTDVNNGQYFRAVQGQAQNQGPRYVPTEFQGQGQGQGLSPYAPQSRYPQQSFGPPQSQYASQPQFPPQYQQQQQQPSPYQAPYPGQRQGGPPLYSSPLSGQTIQSPYGGQFGEGLDGQGGGQGRYPSPQEFGRLAPNGGRPNVQIQFRGEPVQDEGQFGGQIQGQGPEQYYQQGGFPQGFGAGQGQGPVSSGGRQFGGPSLSQQGQGGQGQYVPNFDLDGFSEDADEDGYVDDPPNSLRSGQAEAAEKQGVAIKAVGGGRGVAPGQAYNPQVLGPQGVLQGGVGQRQQPSFEGLGLGQGAGRNPYQGQGQTSSPQIPQLSDEQIQQLLAQQGGQGGFGPQGGQGIPPQYFGQPGFPGGFQQSPQGFAPQGFPGQGRPSGQGQGQPQNSFRPSQNPSFLPQQNPLLQGSLPSQGQGQSQFSQNDFAGFPPQFLPQGQGQGFPGQGQGQGSPFPPQFAGSPQSQSASFPSSPNQGQGGSGGSPQAGSGRPQPGGGPIQSGGFPFDFNPFGDQGGFQARPVQFSQGGFPGQGQGQPGQGQGFPPQGLSPQQFAALQGFSQGPQPQGFPGQGGQGQSLSPGVQGFVPGRGQGGQGQLPPQYLGGLGGSSSIGSPQQVRPNPVGVQLGGGQARPVQAAPTSASGNESRKLDSTSKAGGKSN